jgi:DNA-binding MarR family transcriptional regulator
MPRITRVQALKVAVREPSELTDKAGLSDFTTNKLARTYGRLRQDFRERFSAFSLTPSTLAVLSLIVDNPESSQTAIADAIGVDRSALVPIIDELERRELAIRHRSASDRRAYALLPTAAGIALRDKAFDQLRQHELRAFSKLTVAEKVQLGKILSKILGE